MLAIAGLIFLVVFLALPALQSAQRENALKQDAAHVATAIEQFYADGGNAADVPSSTTATSSGPVPNPQLDPYLKNLNLAGAPNIWIYGNSDPQGRFSAPTVGRHTIDVYFGDKCWTADSPTGGRYPGDKDKQFVPGSPWDAAVVTRFDNYVAYCIDVGRRAAESARLRVAFSRNSPRCQPAEVKFLRDSCEITQSRRFFLRTLRGIFLDQRFFSVKSAPSRESPREKSYNPRKIRRAARLRNRVKTKIRPY